LRKIHCGYPNNPYDTILSPVSFPFVFVSWKIRHVSPKKASSVYVNVRGFPLGSCQFPCKHAPEPRTHAWFLLAPPNVLSPGSPLLDRYYKFVCFVHHVVSSLPLSFLATGTGIPILSYCSIHSFNCFLRVRDSAPFISPAPAFVSSAQFKSHWHPFLQYPIPVSNLPLNCIVAMYATIKTSAFALAAGFAATGAAFDCHGPYFSFYNRGGPSMSYQRLDPALFPGVESPHLHSFDGGNHISASMGFADTQAADCTTARIKPDKSNYWRPTLFWNGNGTGFYRVPDTYLKIYYKFGDPGNVKANVSEFPENFRMIAGNAMLRHDDGVVGTNNGPGLQWSCKQPNYQDINAIGFPKGFTSCPDGFAAQLTFPGCWNGKDLDPSNPSAHMAYPTAGGLGLAACPSGFQVARFPSIFIEFWYDVSAFDNQYSADSIPWVLAMGDPTGYGFHADFVSPHQILFYPKR